MLSCLLGFIFSGSANCVIRLYHAWRSGDRFFAFSCKKDQNNTVNLSKKENKNIVRSCYNTFGATYDSKRTKFLSRVSGIHFETTSLFSREKCYAKLCALAHTFGNFQVCCYCFFSFYSHLWWSFCGVILLHVARVWAGCFTVSVGYFSNALILEFGKRLYNQAVVPCMSKTMHAPAMKPPKHVWSQGCEVGCIMSDSGLFQTRLLKITWMKLACQQICCNQQSMEIVVGYTARILCFNKSLKRNYTILTGTPNLGVWCKKWLNWTSGVGQKIYIMNGGDTDSES